MRELLDVDFVSQDAFKHFRDERILENLFHALKEDLNSGEGTCIQQGLHVPHSKTRDLHQLRHDEPPQGREVAGYRNELMPNG